MVSSLENWHLSQATLRGRLVTGLEGMPCNPMVGDVNSPAYPDVFQRPDVIEQPREPMRAARVSGNPHVQSDRHHLWRGYALGAQLFDAAPSEAVKILAVLEVTSQKVCVVVDHCIGDHQVWSAVLIGPIG